MSEYQPFLISAQKTGIFTYLKPWIGPDDAYESCINAKVYRGTLKKRNGSIQLGDQLEDENPVMGIMQFENESTGDTNLVVATTQNAYLFDDGSQTFNALDTVANSNFWQGKVPGGLTLATPTFWPNIVPSTVSITDGTTTITDDGAGNLTSGGIFDVGGMINYTTGVVSLVFTAPSAGTEISLTISCESTDYFTGTVSDFFNWTNWQPTDPSTFTSSTSYLYMTNNVDPVTLFNGTALSRPIYYWDNPYSAGHSNNNYIETTLDIKVFQNRLLMILPTLANASNPSNQSIFWSAIFNPFNFNNVDQGNGGFLSAATSDIIQSFNFLRDVCVIRFNNSVWLFRFTGSDFAPFVFAKINATKRTNCPYASVEYDERETGIGATGITACDGVNVQRFDINIIDFYETEMSEQFYSQAFSKRYDNNSETWTLYVSSDNNEDDNPLVDGLAPASNKALLFNFVENTWATYEFSIPLMCLGLYNVTSGLTWQDADILWEDADFAWLATSSQATSPNLLGGDAEGNVYWLDNETQVSDAGNAIAASIVSQQWNPFKQLGQKIQFGYIDFYYGRQDDCELELTFYVDNSGSSAATRTLTLDANGTDGNAGSDYAMKRIYINAMGEFLQMQITSESLSGFEILGITLWCRPAGRMTP